MYGCEVLFNQDDAERVCAGVKKALGVDACPCERSEPCPLLPANLGQLMLVKATRGPPGEVATDE